MVTNKKNYKINWFETAFVILNVSIVIFFYKNILLTTILLSLITIIGLVKWKSFRMLSIFVLAGIGGTILEIIAIYIGVWEYSITNFFNVPFWLFILWGNAAMIIYYAAKNIKEKRLKI